MPNDAVGQVSASDKAFSELLNQASAGCPEAAQTLFDHYAKPVLWAIRAKMTPDLRAVWDSTDFLQETRIKLHLCKIQEKSFETPQAFVAFLIRIAEREVQQVKRRNLKRVTLSNGRDRSLQTLSTEEQEQMVESAPQPVTVHAAEDEWQRALKRLPLVYRAVAMRIRQGHTHTEIASDLKICERTVSRAVKMLWKVLGVRPSFVGSGSECG